MARRRRRKGKSSVGTLGGRKVRVKPHSRSPRGPNSGKRRVTVRGYSRRKPRGQR